MIESPVNLDIKLPLFIRSRLDGDRIRVKNMDGTKKVNDIFIDEKLSINDRNRYPILVDNDDNILWIPGLKKSKFDIPFEAEDQEIMSSLMTMFDPTYQNFAMYFGTFIMTYFTIIYIIMLMGVVSKDISQNKWMKSEK